MESRIARSEPPMDRCRAICNIPLGQLQGIVMSLISHDQIAFFETEGYVVLPGFYDLETEIHPILEGIHGIVQRVARRHGIAVPDMAFSPEDFDAGYDVLLATDRKLAAEVY